MQTGTTIDDSELIARQVSDSVYRLLIQEDKDMAVAALAGVVTAALVYHLRNSGRPA